MALWRAAVNSGTAKELLDIWQVEVNLRLVIGELESAFNGQKDEYIKKAIEAMDSIDANLGDANKVFAGITASGLDVGNLLEPDRDKDLLF